MISIRFTWLTGHLYFVMRTIIFFLLFLLITGISKSQINPVFFERANSDTIRKEDSTKYIYTLDAPKSNQGKVQPVLIPTGWTNDFEHILTAEQVVYLDSLVGNFEIETSIEIAIVTIDTSVVDKAGFEKFIKNLSNEWAVGKKGLNNGIVIGISAGLKKIRIHNGYGIEPMLSDIETKRIIDEIMIPEFRKAAYFEGIEKTIIAIISKLKPL